VNPVVNRPNASGTDHRVVGRTMDEPTAWTCTQCGLTKPIVEFAINSWTRTGRRHVCRGCRRDYDRKRNYLRRARNYGHTPVFDDFTEADLVERHGSQCVYCREAPFECVDHLICVRVGGTHILDNVVPSCIACNHRKRLTVDEERIRAYRLTARPAA
jgi:HNH endonuclease